MSDTRAIRQNCDEDMRLLGWQDEIKEAACEAAARRLPKPYYSEPGITVYHADAREILPLFAPGSVSLCLTDPPYGTEGLGGGYGRRQLHSLDGRHGRVIVGDSDLSLLADVLPLLPMACDSWTVAFCAPRRMPEVAELFKGAGFEYYGALIWNKLAPGLGYSIRYSHEDALVFKIGSPPKPEPPIISVFTECVDRTDTAAHHPHAKPVGFWRSALRMSRGLCLDPFMGSGSSLVAAKSLGRTCIGIEIEEKYCAIAVDRLRQSVLHLDPFESAPAPEQLKLET